ncbi:hypothetical protein [Paraburkholderia sp. RL17-347-BIC-D]|uniref:hypothetical protein n=1 Tax=Paraburkholderia sp. RL17-347-BIC-D TaxID=3031632 RepID=UPI0038B77AAF
MTDARELGQSVKPYQLNYSAILDKDGKRFTVHATGLNRTGGYRPFFQVDPALILPPQVDFINIPPTGITNEMITHFHAELTMVAASVLGQQQWSVVVHDTEGQHIVEIEGAKRPEIDPLPNAN